MPLSAVETLEALVKATEEARDTIRELHNARGAALDVIKNEKKRITELLVNEIQEQVKIISETSHDEMQKAVSNVIDRLEKDWRLKLGLD